MLTLEASLLFDGATVYRDDQDPRRFYLLPDRPALALDPSGLPDFLLLRYHLPAETLTAGQSPGGGFASFRCVLATSEAHRLLVLDGLRAQLAREQKEGTQPFGLTIDTPEPALALPPWTATAADWQITPATATTKSGGDHPPLTLSAALDFSLQIPLGLDATDELWSATSEKRAPSVQLIISYRLSYAARAPRTQPPAASSDGKEAPQILPREHLVEAPLDLSLSSPEAIAMSLRDVDLGDSFFTTLTVTASTREIDFSADGIRMIHVFFDYEETDESARDRPLIKRSFDGLLSTSSDRLPWTFYPAPAAPAGHKKRYRWRADVYLADRTLPLDWTTRTDPDLVLTRLDLGIARVDVTLTAGADSVKAAIVSLRAAGSPLRASEASEASKASPLSEPSEDQKLRLTPEDKHASWVQRGAPGGRLHYAYQVSYQTVSAGIVKLPWTDSTSTSLELPGPFAGTLTFELRPDPPLDAGRHIVVSFRYDDPEHEYHYARTVQLDSTQPTAVIAVPILKDGPEEASWSALVFDGPNLLAQLPSVAIRAIRGRS